ncbi:REV1 deoxycytidyl transferase involved in DNA translesion synthesis [Trichoderma parareesei]|uniref:DNA repair protein REV1 n=1 Tax=Trichoderma parareesei TaxID=858221 RepID=A0A2H2ZML3_TRIPA|nr:REV1 deoxycytidyl transferase involved in DNA translesion synthesis [Trichoderma parareesei]
MNSVLEKNSSSVRKRIENHTFEDEEGEEYEGSEFNGFGDYFRRKKIKLQNLDADIRATSDKPPIFKGVVAHVNGYTQPPLHVIHHEIVQHGGGFLQYLDSKTMATHIITATLPPKKAVEFSRYRIVKPAWVVDSVKAGKLLPWADYRVSSESPSQKILKFDGDRGLTQSSPAARRGYREQTDNSFYTSQIRAESHSQLAIQLPEQSALSSRWQNDISDMLPQGTENLAATAREGQLPNEAAAGKIQDESIESKQHVAAEPIVHLDTPKSPSKQMTSEEHNAWLLSDPKIRKSSTANPDFLKQFYSESRLHHLSTWKANLKSSMQRLAAEKGLANRKTKNRPGLRKYIMHVDFDSFFCTVSLKRHPEYVHKPSVVAHSTGAGSEIASCNYVARKFGVKNGMWMKRALELCPDLKVLPYDFPAYEEVSRQFYEAIMETGGIVQSVSVDEALVDVTDVVLAAAQSRGVGVSEGSLWREQAKVDEMALALRNKIKEQTNCSVSVGIGGNILQAKIALRKAKPDGQFQLRPEQVLEVIGDLKVEELPGVAYSIGGKLEDLGVKLVKDLRDISKERLVAVLGPKTSEKLHDYARGIDRTEVGEQPPRKSVSAEVNWGIRFIKQAEAEEFVYNLCKELEKRLVNEQVKGKHLTVKIMRRALDAPLDPTKHLGHGKCDSFNKSAAFGVATHDYQTIGKEAVSILRSFKFSPGDLRGIGVQMTKLEPIRLNALATDGSQRRITFAPFDEQQTQKQQSRAASAEAVQQPDNAKNRQTDGSERESRADEPVTPQKPKPAHGFDAPDSGGSRSTHIQRKASGTQFLLPSSPDPAVLAELPQDIRAKLTAQRPKGAASELQRKAPKSRSQSPIGADLLSSQVDLEVFNALPDDMKEEVLALYGRKPIEPRPQPSPRKTETARSRRPATPTKPSTSRGIFGKMSRQRDAQAGVIQTNFRMPAPAEAQPGAVEELDPNFLAELPEDVRKEVIADHRRRVLALQSGLEAPVTRSHHETSVLPGGQKTIEFPILPPVIAFSGSVTSAQEIKDMVDAWHAQTRKAGPHKRDVDVLERYLVKVIKEERDLSKAVILIKWLDVVVDQDGVDSRGRRAWKLAVNGIKAAMQAAVEERGLAPLQI